MSGAWFGTPALDALAVLLLALGVQRLAGRRHPGHALGLGAIALLPLGELSVPTLPTVPLHVVLERAAADASGLGLLAPGPEPWAWLALLLLLLRLGRPRRRGPALGARVRRLDALR